MEEIGELFLSMTGRDAGLNRAMTGVETRANRVSRSLGRMERQGVTAMDGLGGSAGRLFALFANPAALAVAAVVALTAATVALGVAAGKAAGDAAELESKFQAVFKEEADAATKALDDLADRVNRSGREMRGLASGFQDTFVPLGFARDQASALSLELTQLSVDLASFYNSSDSEAQEKLTSALVGNHEAVRSFGIIITEATLKQELLRLGVEGGTQAATEQQKVMARLNIIMRSTSDAQGDAERTSDSWNNTLRGLKGAWGDLLVALGNLAIPALKELARLLRVMVGWLAENTESVQSWGDAFGSAVGVVVDAMLGLSELVTRVGFAWEKTGIQIVEFAANAYARIQWFVDNATELFTWFFGNVGHMLEVFGENTLQIFLNVGDNIVSFFESTWDYIKTGGTEAFRWDPKSMTAGLKDFLTSPEWQAFQKPDFDDVWNDFNARWDKAMRDDLPDAARAGAEQAKLDIEAMFNELAGKADATSKKAKKAAKDAKTQFRNTDQVFEDRVKSRIDKQLAAAEKAAKDAEKFNGEIKPWEPGDGPVSDEVERNLAAGERNAQAPLTAEEQAAIEASRETAKATAKTAEVVETLTAATETQSAETNQLLADIQRAIEKGGGLQ